MNYYYHKYTEYNRNSHVVGVMSGRWYCFLSRFRCISQYVVFIWQIIFFEKRYYFLFVSAFVTLVLFCDIFLTLGGESLAFGKRTGYESVELSV